jgi:putative multiple sugar transport system substrate-binding protein
MKRLLAAMIAALMMVSLGSIVISAGGGNSDKAHLCQKNGYLALSGTAGPFTSEDACVSYAANGGVLNLPVGIVLPSSYTVSTRSHRAALENALAAAGYSAEFRTSYGVNSERAEVEALIGQGIKVLVLTSWDSAAGAAAAEGARAAGVKVIAYDRLILSTAAVDYFVTFDGMAIGAAQAQYLIDKAGATTGNNLYLYAGNPADNNSFLFLEGAWEKLQPKIADGTFVIRNSSVAVDLQAHATLSRAQQAAIIDQVTTYWDPGTAWTMAVANLAAVPPAAKGTAFILAPNDATAGAISDAFATDRDVMTYIVTGQDADQAWVQDLICGTKGMTVFKSPRTLAEDTVTATVAFLTSRTPVATTTYDNGLIAVPSRVSAIVTVTIDNIQAALIDTGFYEASDFSGTWPGKP